LSAVPASTLPPHPDNDQHREVLLVGAEEFTPAESKQPSRRRVEPVILVGASAVYLMTVIRTALLLYGF